MKIEIITNDSNGLKSELTPLYNLIKRNEENFLHREPRLREFIVELRNSALLALRAQRGHSSKYILAENGQSIKLIITSLSQPNVDTICQLATKEIENIKHELDE
jgi:cell division cycle-associated protein 8